MALDYIISKKRREDETWGDPIASLPGTATSFIDTNVRLGEAYEYQVKEDTTYWPWPKGEPWQWWKAYGYIYAGIAVPAPDYRGKIILLVEKSLLRPLADRIARLERDLVGDGWVALTHYVAADETIPNIKQIILNDWNADPAYVQALFIVGHVPVPYSGDFYPDEHPDHRGAWPADAYYGDMTGTWTDDTVNFTNATYPANSNVRGDGKFDQTVLPARVLLQVGRVDLSNLPAFLPKTEVELLQQYLDKDHNYRHALFRLPNRGLILDNFGVIDGDAPAATPWRVFPEFFGRAGVTEIPPGSYFSTLGQQAYLWSYAGGGGDFTHADGIGTTADFAAHEIQTVFTILHGSYFGDWNTKDNLLRAPLATRNYPLVCNWSGLPHWFFHHMALGEPIGYSARLTMNNNVRGLYRMQANYASQEAHIALMGDPTLRMFMVAPASNLRATASNRVTLAWQASTDPVAGYLLYRSTSPSGPFARVTPDPINEVNYVDTPPSAGSYTYMVRALALQVTGSGTFFNPSEGIFAQTDFAPTNQPPTAVEDAVATFLNKPVEIPISLLLANDTAAEPGTSLKILAVSSPSAHGGKVALTNAAIEYFPPDGFLGNDSFDYTLGDSEGGSAVGHVTVSVRRAPRITSITLEPDHQLRVAFEGPAGEAYQIEASSDLREWIKLSAGALGAEGTGEFFQPDDTRQRFFRVSFF